MTTTHTFPKRPSANPEGGRAGGPRRQGLVSLAHLLRSERSRVRLPGPGGPQTHNTRLQHSADRKASRAKMAAHEAEDKAAPGFPSGGRNQPERKARGSPGPGCSEPRGSPLRSKARHCVQGGTSSPGLTAPEVGFGPANAGSRRAGSRRRPATPGASGGRPGDGSEQRM